MTATTSTGMAPAAESDRESDYGDFGDDEDLAIIDQLFADAAFDASLVVTDIEDYEPPRGIRLPKIFGYEARSTQSQINIEVLRDQHADCESHITYVSIY